MQFSQTIIFAIISALNFAQDALSVSQVLQELDQAFHIPEAVDEVLGGEINELKYKRPACKPRNHHGHHDNHCKPAHCSSSSSSSSSSCWPTWYPTVSSSSGCSSSSSSSCSSSSSSSSSCHKPCNKPCPKPCHKPSHKPHREHCPHLPYLVSMSHSFASCGGHKGTLMTVQKKARACDHAQLIIMDGCDEVYNSNMHDSKSQVKFGHGKHRVLMSMISREQHHVSGSTVNPHCPRGMLGNCYDFKMYRVCFCNNH